MAYCGFSAAKVVPSSGGCAHRLKAALRFLPREPAEHLAQQRRRHGIDRLALAIRRPQPCDLGHVAFELAGDGLLFNKRRDHERKSGKYLLVDRRNTSSLLCVSKKVRLAIWRLHLIGDELWQKIIQIKTNT